MKTIFKNYTVTASPLRMLCTVLCWVLLSLQVGFAQQENKVIIGTDEGEEELNTSEVQYIRFDGGRVTIAQPWGQMIYERRLRELSFFRPMPGKLRLTAKATIGEERGMRRALGLDGSGKVKSTWAADDQVYVYADAVSTTPKGVLIPQTTGAASTTLVGDIDMDGRSSGQTPFLETKARPFSFAAQAGTLQSLFYAKAEATFTKNGANGSIAAAMFSNPQSITRFTMKDGNGNNVAVKALTITGGAAPISVTLEEASAQVYVAMPQTNATTAYSFTATASDDQVRTGTKRANVQDGKYYLADVTVKLTPVVTAPVANTLNYNGTAQALVSAASAPGGTVQYKLGGGSYDTAIPTATAIGSYTVYYKVTGDADHHDVPEASVPVTIGRGIGSISFATDAANLHIGMDTEYTQAVTKVGDGTVTYSSSDEAVASINASTGEATILGVGTTTITATVVNGTNYDYAVKTATYTITVSKANGAISYTSVNQNVAKNFGDANFSHLVTTNNGGGSVTYSAPAANGVATVTSAGQVSIIGVGSVVITATAHDTETVTYAGHNTATYTLTVSKATPSITLTPSSGSVYLTLTTNFTASVANAANGSVYDGTLSVGTSNSGVATATISNGTVTVTGVGEGNATITVTASSTANWNGGTAVYSIHVDPKAPSSVTTAPTAQNRTYTGSAQTLLNNVGVASGGTLYYKTTETNSEPASTDGFTSASSGYSQTNAKTYYVWYYIKGDATHLDSEIYGPVTATINPKTVSSPTITLGTTSYTYDGSAKTPTPTVKDGSTTIPSSEYTVSYSNNTNAGTATVTISDKANGNYTVSGSTTFTINKADATMSYLYGSAEFSTTDNINSTQTRTINCTGCSVTGASVTSGSGFTVSRSGNTITITRNTTDSFSGTVTVYGIADNSNNYNNPSSITISVSGWEYFPTHNWQAYVDLGNPSCYYATRNIGANSSTQYGSYFAWGETYTKNSFTNSSYSNSASSISSDLTPSQDAARANWGGSWRMPTDEELNWLRWNCTWTRDSSSGGYTLTSKISGYTNKSIFLPAAGYKDESGLNHPGDLGAYWSSTINSDSSVGAWSLSFQRGDQSMYSTYRYCGKTIRPVLSK